MSGLPDYQPTRLAEGEYRFIIADYEKRKHEGGAVTVKFTFKVEMPRGGYRKHIESDAALERRFQPITVGEPSVEETIEILRGVRSAYERHHQL